MKKSTTRIVVRRGGHNHSLLLSSTKLEQEVHDRISGWISLKKLKPRTKGYYIVNLFWHKPEDYKSISISVVPSLRVIGCCTLTKKDWAKVMRAATKARKEAK